MKRVLDGLGRLCLPKEMRKELKLDDGSMVNIELVEGSIVVTNPDEIDYKARCEEALKYLDDLYDCRFTDKDKNKLINILKGEE